MDRATYLQNLEDVDDHIVQGKEHIAKQEATITALERDGHLQAVKRAKELLVVLRDTQKEHEAHRQHILDELAKT